MNTQMAFRHQGIRDFFVVQEKIEIMRIKLIKPTGRCVVVNEIRSADRILGEWFDPSKNIFECEFVVEFLDGFIVRGNYYLLRSSRRRPSLYKYLREKLKGIELGQKISEDLPCVSLSPSELDFFNKYSLGLD